MNKKNILEKLGFNPIESAIYLALLDIDAALSQTITPLIFFRALIE